MTLRRGRAVLFAVALAVSGVVAGSLVAMDPAGAVSAPMVGSVSPTSGKTAGGTRVTVTGIGFTQVRSVKFGTVSGTSISVASSTKLAVTAPAHAAGVVDVRVTTRYGTSTIRTVDRYTYVAPPKVSAVSPTWGKTAAGTRVTVTGASFVHVTSVKFGTVSGTSISVASSTKLAVTAPAHAAGTVNVRVVTAYGTSPITPHDVFAYLAPLAVATASLANGTAGAPYLAVLTVTGGAAPYSWTSTALPDGLSFTADGRLSGMTAATSGPTSITFTVADVHGWRASKTLSVAFPNALPANCLTTGCTDLAPDANTVQIPATRIGSILANGSGPYQVIMTGPAPSPNQVLVIAPTTAAPSGAIVVVDAVTANPDGTFTVDVRPAGPADAYNEGDIKVVGPPSTPSTAQAALNSATAAQTTTRSGSLTKSGSRGQAVPVASSSLASVISCDKPDVSVDLYGLDVTPSLTPSVVALWKHPLFGGGGFYPGIGGLSLFQFDLDGDLTLNFGFSASGSANCSLDLPSYHSAIPAGELGAVLLDLTPTVTLNITGKIDIRESVTLHCGAEYRWDNGTSYRVSYCQPSVQPLQVSNDTGVDATLTATLNASVTLDDLVGITGNLTPSMHGGFHPVQQPLAEIDAKLTGTLGACLACFWSGSPANVTVLSGTIFAKTLATWATAPPRVPAATPPSITTSGLPTATVGQPYAARLTTADNRNGTWSIDSGSLPTGLYLSGEQIVGKAAYVDPQTFTVGFVDPNGLSASRVLSINVVSGDGSGGGALQNPDFCQQNVLAANDDNSTDAVTLPFTIALGGTTYDSVYISNNGYVTFDAGSGIYTPYAMADAGSPIIAPYFADVDTRPASSPLVTYGASPDGSTFCADWIGVGYYDEHIDKTVSFQLLLTNQSNTGPGNFDITFNYGSMQWETGDASDGVGGIGGVSARSGYADGAGHSLELPGSGVSGALLDGGSDALITSSNVGVPGRWQFAIRN